MALIFGFTLLELVFGLVALLFIGTGMFYAKRRWYGISALATLGVVALAGYLMFPTLEPLLKSPLSFAQLAVEVVLGYLAIGILVSFVNWGFYVWLDVRRNYDKFLETFKPTSSDISDFIRYQKEYAPAGETTDETWAREGLKLKAITKQASQIFEFENDNLPSWDSAVVDSERTMVGFRREIDKLLPPKFKNFKSMIVNSALAWPITVLTLVLSNILEKLYTKLMELLHGVYDAISKAAFGQA